MGPELSRDGHRRLVWLSSPVLETIVRFSRVCSVLCVDKRSVKFDRMLVVVVELSGPSHGSAPCGRGLVWYVRTVNWTHCSFGTIPGIGDLPILVGGSVGLSALCGVGISDCSIKVVSFADLAAPSRHARPRLGDSDGHCAHGTAICRCTSTHALLGCNELYGVHRVQFGYRLCPFVITNVARLVR